MCYTSLGTISEWYQQAPARVAEVPVGGLAKHSRDRGVPLRRAAESKVNS